MAKQQNLAQLFPWLSEEQIAERVKRDTLLPHQKALLNTIAGPESGHQYNVIYGGSTFSDYSQHPAQYVPIQSGPNKGKTSSAAGKYQFLKGTWDDYQNRLGLPDFSPDSQDRAAWALASDTYKKKTGNDLDAVLRSGNPAAIAGIGNALNEVWTSAPGGIEQGSTVDSFLNSYASNLGRPMAEIPVPVETPSATTEDLPEYKVYVDLMSKMAKEGNKETPLLKMSQDAATPVYGDQLYNPLDEYRKGYF